MSEQQAELNILVHNMGFTMEEFLSIAETSKGETHLLIKLAEALLTIQNLTIQNDKYKEAVEALDLRLDLANVPRDCTENDDKLIIT